MLAMSLRATVRMALIGLLTGSAAIVAITIGAYFVLDKVQSSATFFNAFSMKVSQFNLLTAELFVQRSGRALRQWNRQHKILTEQLSAAPELQGSARVLAGEIGQRLQMLRRVVDRLEPPPPGMLGDLSRTAEARELLFEAVMIHSGAIVSRTVELRRIYEAKAAQKQQWLFLLVGGGFLMLMIGGGLVLMLISNRLLSRMLALRKVIREIDRGNLDAEMPLFGRDEMGDVFRQLHQMRINLIQSMGELSQVNMELTAAKAELEDRVAQRTERLEAANRELEAFTYTVSHDLRAPLRAISGFSQAVLEDHSERIGADGAAMLRRINGATQRMSQLIEDLLKLSRINKSQLDISEVDLSAITAEICRGLEERNPARNAAFKIEENIKLRCDSGLIAIVLTNLIENAWKFTKNRPEAEITFGQRVIADKPAIFVRDNGAGFDMAFSERLFQPFQRLHSPAEFAGTGIGLATVARIIALHGGKIWAEAKPDQGAAFYFQLGNDLTGSKDVPEGALNRAEPVKRTGTG